jgi:hypothetical protein
VDLEIVWLTATESLPLLIAALEPLTGLALPPSGAES